MSSFNSNVKKPIQIDCDHDSITIAWNIISNVKYYELSMKTIEDNETPTSESSSASDWIVLSNKLTNNFVRKKNLKSKYSYIFRIRYSINNDNDNWSEYSEISDAYSPLIPLIKQPNAPILVTSDSNSITISWEPVPNAIGYKLQYRSINILKNSPIEWNEIGSVLTNTNAKKKNLLPDVDYHFRICPIFDSNSNSNTESNNHNYTFSKSSEAFHVHIETFPTNLISLFPKQLLQKPPTSPVATLNDMQLLLKNKLIGVYFSAHWCGPCRKFTPLLTSIYQESKQSNLPFEIIFCSADHSETECNDYYNNNMPWLSVPYNDDHRENLQNTFKVNGIPRLIILNGVTGAIIANNALDSGSITIDSVKQWIKLL